MALTEKMMRFAQEYIVDLNAGAAAIRAGYSEKTAYSIGHENLRKPEIAEYIQKLMDERSKRTEITADMVLQEYAKIGFSNISDYLKVEERQGMTETGDTITYKAVDIFVTDSIQRDKLDAVAEIKQTKDGIALKLHDKKGALDSIARHLGMFNDKLEHSGSVKSEVTHNLKKLDPKELANLEHILVKASNT